jgi:hypothetical protein
MAPMAMSPFRCIGPPEKGVKNGTDFSDPKMTTAGFFYLETRVHGLLLMQQRIAQDTAKTKTKTIFYGAALIFYLRMLESAIAAHDSVVCNVPIKLNFAGSRAPLLKKATEKKRTTALRAKAPHKT